MVFKPCTDPLSQIANFNKNKFSKNIFSKKDIPFNTHQDFYLNKTLKGNQLYLV